MPEKQLPRGRFRLWSATGLGLLVLAALVFAIVAADQGTRSDSASSLDDPQSPTSAGGFFGAEVPGDRAAAPIDLTDQHGSRISLTRFRGEPVILTFVYTRCGDPCAVIAQQIRGALNELAHPVPTIFVSVDPHDDTRSAIRRFLTDMSLGARVYYLTGTTAQLAPIWRAYRIKPATEGLREFETSVSVALIDREGSERVLYSLEQLTPEAIAHDIGKLQSD